jgi:hypothetical protein
MGDTISSLPQFPPHAREELPPPRRPWIDLLITISVVFCAGGSVMLLCLFCIIPAEVSVRCLLLGGSGTACSLALRYALDHLQDEDR